MTIAANDVHCINVAFGSLYIIYIHFDQNHYGQNATIKYQIRNIFNNSP
jgi:hypothetical protein